MKVDVDLIQRMKVTGLFSLQIYKVVTGTMLSIFVPQGCDDMEINTTRICSLQENYENEDLYHQICFYTNCLSMCAFLVTYGLEIKRENWAIQYLDIDKNKSDNALKAILREEPDLDKKMDILNLLYWRSLVGTSLLYSINLGLTVNLLSDNYHSSSTISCFLSFTLLVLMKLYNSLCIARSSLQNDTMCSAYLTEFASYNVLDATFLEDRSNPRSVSDSDSDRGSDCDCDCDCGSDCENKITNP